MLFCASSEGSGESAHLHMLTLAFVTIPKYNVLPQMAICVLFTQQRRLWWVCTFVQVWSLDNKYQGLMRWQRLHIYICSPESRCSSKISCAGSNGDLVLFCASSEGSGESSHLHMLTLAFVTLPKSHVLPQKNDLRAIHARSVDSCESADFRRHSH